MVALNVQTSEPIASNAGSFYPAASRIIGFRLQASGFRKCRGRLLLFLKPVA
jgi:hypothetical protein